MKKIVFLSMILINMISTCFAQSADNEQEAMLNFKVYEISESLNNTEKEFKLITNSTLQITNNVETEFFMGDYCPINPNNNHVIYHKTGINLIVLPLIADGKIDLDINTDISLISEITPQLKTNDYKKIIHFSGFIGDEFIFNLKNKYQVKIAIN